MNNESRSASDIDIGSQPDQDSLTLAILDTVHRDAHLTQRALARDLGIALGLANSYLRRCLNKGYIKVTQAPSNRYSYYLTPTGFAEKSRLVGQYLYQSFNLFRAAREQYDELFRRCETLEWRRIALAGTGDLAEIALLSIRSSSIDLIGILDRHTAAGTFAGVPVSHDPAAFAPLDAVVISDLATSQLTYAWLRETLPTERVLAPRMLRIADPPTEERP